MDPKIDIREAGDVTVVDLGGRVTLGESAMALRDRLRELTRQGHKKLLLNLANVSFFDSTGIGVLVSAYATAGAAGGSMKLCCLSKRVKDVLLITKLYTASGECGTALVPEGTRSLRRQFGVNRITSRA